MTRLSIVALLLAADPAPAQDETDKQKQACVHIGHIAIAVMMYREFNGDWPKSLKDLVEKPREVKFWPEGGYLAGGKLPKDPWGRDYQFKGGEREPKVWSWGADGKEGGEGEDADLTLEDVFRERASEKRAAPRLAGNERNAVGALKTIVTAEADFRSNDRDNNRVNDFWTADVAGLYCIDNTNTGAAKPSMIKLIEVSIALADHAPHKGGALSNGNYKDPITKLGKSAPKDGYWFVMLKEDVQITLNGGQGDYRQDTDATGDDVHCTSRFGICAFPADYPKSGKRTFIVNEGNTIFAKDTGGKPPEKWPADADIAKEWEKID